MTITRTAIGASFDNADLASYSTASLNGGATPGYFLACIGNRQSAATVATPTLSGMGLTWVQIDTMPYAGNVNRITWFRAYGTPTTGVVTIDFGGVTQICCEWDFNRYDGVDPSGTNGSGGIVQSTQGSGTSTTPSFTHTNAIAAANNCAVVAFRHPVNEGTTPRASAGTNVWVETGDSPHALPSVALETQFGAPTAGNVLESTVSASWLTNSVWAGIAIELAAAVATDTGRMLAVF